jgi:drug/metabolite transporter (DMT)-like permease
MLGIKKMFQQFRGFLYVILSAVIFGCIPLVVKNIYNQGGNAITVIFLRAWLSLPVLYVLMRREGGTLRVPLKRLKKLVILSIGFASTTILLFTSYHFISTGVATTIHFIYPVFVLLGSILFFKEPFDRVKFICVLLCTLGIVMFYTPGEAGSFVGLILSFASGLTFAFYVIYLDKSGLKRLKPFTLGFYLAAVTSVELFICALLSNELALAMTLKGWALCGVLAISVSVGGVVLFQVGVREIGVQSTSILSTFEPATSIIIGVIMFSEPLGVKTTIGVGLILASVIWLTIGSRKQRVTKFEPKREMNIKDSK